MHIQVVSTNLIKPNSTKILNVVDANIKSLPERSVIVVSSKIVSLCEGNVASVNKTDKDDLIIKTSQYYIERSENPYNSIITIVKNSLMLAAGIDESNSNGKFVLWPKDALKSAKEVYDFLHKKYKLKELGVLIVDSTSKPLRIGTVGTSLSHWGFLELNDYRGTTDLFGKKMAVSQSNVAESLATAAVLAMGEGTEQTPLAIITDIPFVQFDATKGGSCYTKRPDLFNNDVYGPILSNAPWKKGGDTEL